MARYRYTVRFYAYKRTEDSVFTKKRDALNASAPDWAEGYTITRHANSGGGWFFSGCCGRGWVNPSTRELGPDGPSPYPLHPNQAANRRADRVYRSRLIDDAEFRSTEDRKADILRSRAGWCPMRQWVA